MNFALFDQLPREDMKMFLEHIVRSIPESFKTPLSLDQDAPSRIVDKEGKVFADCKSSHYSEKLLQFLKDLDAWLV